MRALVGLMRLGSSHGGRFCQCERTCWHEASVRALTFVEYPDSLLNERCAIHFIGRVDEVSASSVREPVVGS